MASRAFPLLLAVLVSRPAFGGDLERQFDLVCEGQMREKVSDPIWHRMPFRTELRVDLETGSFCYDSCGDVYKLTHWSASELRYSYDSEKAGRTRETGYWSNVADIDRFTVTFPSMKFRRTYIFERCSACTAGQHVSEKIAGTCRKIAFSGLSFRPDEH